MATHTSELTSAGAVGDGCCCCCASGSRGLGGCVVPGIGCCWCCCTSCRAAPRVLRPTLCELAAYRGCTARRDPRSPPPRHHSLHSCRTGWRCPPCQHANVEQQVLLWEAVGRGWRVVHNKQKKQAALPAMLRQAPQAMSPSSTRQTTQSLEVRFMPSWRTLGMYFVVPRCRRSVALWYSTTPCMWSSSIFFLIPYTTRPG